MSSHEGEHRDRGPATDRDPEIHSGDEVFAGTRVPVDTLWDHLSGGQPVDDFLAGFPSVQRWQVEEVIENRLKAIGGALADRSRNALHSNDPERIKKAVEHMDQHIGD